MQLQILSQKKYSGHNGAIYKLLPFPGTGFFYSTGGDGWIVKWDPSTSPDGVLKAQDTDVIFCLSHIFESGIIAGTFQGNLLLFNDIEAGADVRKIQGHKKGVFDLLYRENQLITCGGDGRVTQWDCELMVPLQSIQISSRSVRNMAFDVDNRLIYAGASDGNISVIDFDEFALRHTFNQAHERAVFKICSIPGGNEFLSGGMDARLKKWKTDEISAIADVPAHSFTINDMAIHPNGKILATASRDKKIRIWDMEGLILMKELGGHLNSVNTIFWSQAGDLLFSGSDDRTIMQTEIALQE